MRCKKMIICLLVLLFSLPTVFGVSAAETAVSIAVAANGSERNATVSEKAGRAAYFLLFDGEGIFLAAERNPFADVPGGAGPQAAAFLADEGVTLIVAGEFGAKMERVLKSFNIQYVIHTGVSHEVVQTVLQSK
ncbi:MAG: NifB/NifX family molybdenum-iron cluster-binding protein [Thermodesulfobacteriota bacterium]